MDYINGKDETILTPYFIRYQEIASKLLPNMQYMLYDIHGIWWLKTYTDIEQSIDIRLGDILQAIMKLHEMTAQMEYLLYAPPTIPLQWKTSRLLEFPEPYHFTKLDDKS